MNKGKFFLLMSIVLMALIQPISNRAPVSKISTHPDSIAHNDFGCRIAVDNAGNSYVAWVGFDGTDREIYWVKVNAAGVPGTVQKVSIHPDNINNDDEFPEIAVNSPGNSYVVWGGYDGNDWEIYYTALLKPTITIEERTPDVNGSIMPLASYRISQARSLLEEAHEKYTQMEGGNDPLCSECFLDKMNEATKLLELAEKFYTGGNYIAANYWALMALDLLQQIEECCKQ